MTQTLASVTMKDLVAMRDHPMHAAATLLVPALRNFSFVREISRRDIPRLAGKTHLKKLMAASHQFFASGTKARELTKEVSEVATEAPNQTRSTAGGHGVPNLTSPQAHSDSQTVPGSATRTSGGPPTPRACVTGKRKIADFLWAFRRSRSPKRGD